MTIFVGLCSCRCLLHFGDIVILMLHGLVAHGLKVVSRETFSGSLSPIIHIGDFAYKMNTISPLVVHARRQSLNVNEEQPMSVH